MHDHDVFAGNPKESEHTILRAARVRPLIMWLTVGQYHVQVLPRSVTLRHSQTAEANESCTRGKQRWPSVANMPPDCPVGIVALPKVAVTRQ